MSRANSQSEARAEAVGVGSSALLGCWRRTRMPWPPGDRPPPPTRHHPGHQRPPHLMGFGRWWLTRHQAEGWKARGTTMPSTTTRQRDTPVAGLALRGHGAACCPAAGPRRTRLQDRRRRPCLGAGCGATRPRGTRAPSDGDTPPAPGKGVGASTGERTTPRLPLSGPRVTTRALQAGWDAHRTCQRVQGHRSVRGSTTAAEGLA